MRKVFTLMMMMITLAACTSSKPGAKMCGAGIISGNLLSSSSAIGSSTVFVVFITKDHKMGVCSGTLIAPQLVLTAQHCAEDTEFEGVVFNDHAMNLSGHMASPHMAVDSKRTYSSGTETNADDLAILHLPSPAPSNYTVQALPSANFDLNQATSFTMAGFGITDECSDDAGTLRSTSVPASNLLFSYQEPKMLMFDDSTTGVCHGDSGGPLFAVANGQSQFVGVAEAVASNIRGDDRHECHGESLFVDVRTHLDWIKSTSSELSN